ncbi:hypothetical protein C2869_08105 [Saccharobesus litoralis]|uniref:Uncharacterized protein n=1 Tax=Saccharobesus litoralis TaxID=2172099 RepID=A0A2S0VQD2_9ALTE|nr:hypothetical protein [Saccharobesus litoralis]AWB66392.1 hypothetical protein C2869_08105 [Saccharobesus litoralis]
MDIKVIVALIGLLGVLASALVQYFLGRQAETRKKLIEIRAQAYLDLVNIVSEIASSSKHSVSRQPNQLKSLTQAKTRAVLVGSDEVVEAIENFWNKFGILATDESFSAFTLIVLAMRKDLTGNNKVSESNLNSALFGSKGSA